MNILSRIAQEEFISSPQHEALGRRFTSRLLANAASEFTGRKRGGRRVKLLFPLDIQEIDYVDVVMGDEEKAWHQKRHIFGVTHSEPVDGISRYTAIIPGDKLAVIASCYEPNPANAQPYEALRNAIASDYFSAYAQDVKDILDMVQRREL